MGKTSTKAGRSRKRARQWEERNAKRQESVRDSDVLSKEENKRLHSTNAAAYMDDEVDVYNKSVHERIPREMMKSAGITIDGDADSDDDDDDYVDNEEEVLPIDSGGDSDSVDLESDTDSLGRATTDDPAAAGALDPHAWGKKRSSYYTHASEDVGEAGWSGSDAELEEEEAALTQARHADQLGEDDFGLATLLGHLTRDGGTGTEDGDKTGQTVDKVKVSLDKLSKRELLELVEKHAPELPGLCGEFSEILTQCEERWYPLYAALTGSSGAANTRGGNRLVEYVNTKLQLSLRYCVNVAFYFLLRSRGGVGGQGNGDAADTEDVSDHPVIQRLVTFRSLINDLDSKINPSTLHSEIDALLNALTRENQVNSKKISEKTTVQCKETMKKLKTAKRKGKKAKTKTVSSTESQEIAVDADVDMERMLRRMEANDDDDGAGAIETQTGNVANGETAAAARRPISYEIEKNKVVVRQKRAEQRNPRVKHRVKYRRANIRRKGQVRPHRYEMSRYSGELSGINRQVVKSVKLT